VDIEGINAILLAMPFGNPASKFRTACARLVARHLAGDRTLAAETEAIGAVSTVENNPFTAHFAAINRKKAKQIEPERKEYLESYHPWTDTIVKSSVNKQAMLQLGNASVTRAITGMSPQQVKQSRGITKSASARSKFTPQELGATHMLQLCHTERLLNLSAPSDAVVMHTLNEECALMRDYLAKRALLLANKRH
jgi:hypothetical protein